MKLRTTKKQKSNDYDIGCDSAPDQTHKKSSTMKTQTEKDGLSSNEVIFIYLYIFQNSNLSNENEGKNRHKLRNSVHFSYLIIFSPQITKENTKK